MIDKNIMLRDGAVALNADELTPTGVDFGGADLEPQAYTIWVPQATGTTPTLDVTIQVSDDNSTWVDYLKFPQITAKGKYTKTGKTRSRYRRAVCDVGGTTPNFGNVKIAPMPAGEYTDW